MAESDPPTEDGLTPEQIANWKMVFPELRFIPDEMVQAYRNRFQSLINEMTEKDEPHG